MIYTGLALNEYLSTQGAGDKAPAGLQIKGFLENLQATVNSLSYLRSQGIVGAQFDPASGFMRAAYHLMPHGLVDTYLKDNIARDTPTFGTKYVDLSYKLVASYGEDDFDNDNTPLAINAMTQSSYADSFIQTFNFEFLARTCEFIKTLGAASNQIIEGGAVLTDPTSTVAQIQTEWDTIFNSIYTYATTFDKYEFGTNIENFKVVFDPRAAKSVSKLISNKDIPVSSDILRAGILENVKKLDGVSFIGDIAIGKSITAGASFNKRTTYALNALTGLIAHESAIAFPIRVYGWKTREDNNFNVEHGVKCQYGFSVIRENKVAAITNLTKAQFVATAFRTDTAR